MSEVFLSQLFLSWEGNVKYDSELDKEPVETVHVEELYSSKSKLRLKEMF